MKERPVGDQVEKKNAEYAGCNRIPILATGDATGASCTCQKPCGRKLHKTVKHKANMKQIKAPYNQLFRPFLTSEERALVKRFTGLDLPTENPGFKEPKVVEKNMRIPNNEDVGSVGLSQNSIRITLNSIRPRPGTVTLASGRTARAKGSVFPLLDERMLELGSGHVAPPDHPRSSRLRVVRVKTNLSLPFDSLSRFGMHEALERYLQETGFEGLVENRTGLRLATWKIEKRNRPFASNRFQADFTLISDFGYERGSLQAIRETILPNVSDLFYRPMFSSEVTFRGKQYGISFIKMVPCLVSIGREPGPQVLEKLARRQQSPTAVIPTQIAA